MSKKISAEERVRKMNQYNDEYKKTHYDRINVLLPKGKKAEISAIASANGLSMAKFVLNAIEEWIENHETTTYTIK